ncbi:hypothetical protein [Siccirubricoccus sp. G192]|uniref:phage tail protein n=1 Tax=Siccirubricoccus sp. G192 TaxID=2849651 RepID=UPI001C2C09DA|nr:hypothetical protein [Siccirubricoccus sp. G192]MBV1800698.1 hypothetical protein [Siccirubricoccus sp. G192]
MMEARLTPEKLARANEPSFAAAGVARQQAEGHSRTGPAEMRQAEAQLRGQAQAEAVPALAQGMGELVRARGGAFGRVASQQGATKSQDEAARERVSAQLDAIQTRTRADVQKTLDEMDAEATRLFEAGLARALQAFERERERLEEEARREQASEWFNTAGLLGAVVGYFWSLGKERVERAIAGARAAYDNVVRETIDQVAAVVGGKLTAAKDRVRQGRAEADALVAGLPAELRTFGQEARAKLDGEFERMGGEIEERKGGLIDRLGEKYAESRRQVDERAQAFRDANKSLWDRAKEAVAGVIQTIMEFRALLLGILAKAAGVVDSILDDPIRFLRNLVSGVKAGLDAFIANIVNHLKAGFMQWLFGTLAAAGIQIPERFDLKGIFGLILSVLGLTYANIRARAVRLLGEPLVARLESVAEVFKILITEGPAGIWRMLLERLEALKEQVLGQVREMLIVQVLKAGVVWLIGLLNPASAFVKACKAIYDIVMFFVERGRQIAEFVNSILDSLAAIVAGNLGAMARAVEGALARAVPVVIGFLANLLGLGGLSEKIKKIIEKIQEPVNKAIDWVIGKAVELAKKVGQLFGGKKEKGAKEEADPEKKAKIEAGLAALEEAEAAREVEGKIDRKEAEAVAIQVKRQHPVFKSIVVVDGGASWDYEYVASPGIRYKGGFKGASKAVREGIARLRALAQNENIPYPYRIGINAQLRRAEELHRSGRLVGVEVTQPQGKGRIDFELTDPDQVVEYKYWTSEYTQNNMAKLIAQLRKYQSAGKQVVLELGTTKTKPITIGFVEGVLRSELEKIQSDVRGDQHPRTRGDHLG